MSATADLAIVGAEVVLPAGPQRCGVAVSDGRIVAIALEAELPAARETLDASGAVLLPGAIDVHMHYDRDGRLTDRVGDATRSAAHGGVTSLIAFLLAEPSRRLVDTLDDAIAELERESHLDVGFHMYLKANDVDALSDVPRLVARGVSSFKMNMDYKRRGMMCSDEFLVTAMSAIARSGGIAMVHAEAGEAIDYLEQQAMAEGRNAPTDYAATRPPYTEAEAVMRAAMFGRAIGCPVYVVHLTSAAALRALMSARADGFDVTAETCPQYLTLTDDAMARLGPLAKIAPPLRTEVDQEALWRGLRDGDLALVASDHAPYPSAQKLAARDDIFRSPFGAPTVETLLPLLHSEGVVRRGLGLEWLARVTSEHPARVFGLYPRKGAIEVGSDADLVVLDPSKQVEIEAAGLHSNADYTPFVGLPAQGWPVVTIVGGEVLVRDGQLRGRAGRRRFLAREAVRTRLRDRVGGVTAAAAKA